MVSALAVDVLSATVGVLLLVALVLHNPEAPGLRRLRNACLVSACVLLAVLVIAF